MKKHLIILTLLMSSVTAHAYKQGTQMFGPNGQPGLLEPVPNPAAKQNAAGRFVIPGKGTDWLKDTGHDKLLKQ